MRRAFTLIELLVVIAIIAVLAAILFPVIVQAKIAAKKTQSISNLKQIGISLLLYCVDHEDTYPRNDGCIPQSSLNEKLNLPSYVPSNGDGCRLPGPYPWRQNHFTWQKWVLPYMKNLEVFVHPRLQRSEFNWNWSGELMNGYALNLALTGAINTYDTSPGQRGRWRNSFLGGTQTAIPDVSSAFILFELASASVNFAPVFTVPNMAPQWESQTAYPVAQREVWKPMFYRWPTTSACYPLTSQIDPSKTPWADGLVLGRADSSAKFYHVNRFLAETPSAAEYLFPNGWLCGPTSGAWSNNTAPSWSRPWPLWALQ